VLSTCHFKEFRTHTSANTKHKVIMDHTDNDDKKQSLAIEHMKQIIKDKLNQKNTELTNSLDLLYNKALMDIDAIEINNLTSDDINKFVNDILNDNLATS
jgi:hypothetical protein